MRPALTNQDPGMSVLAVEEWAPMPKPERICLRCWAIAERERLSPTWAHTIVSPSGVGHYAKEYGQMECGADGTKDGWMWPL